MDEIKKRISELLLNISLEEKIQYINSIREYIHELSPFKNEPVDFVKWVVADNVIANDYNPNKVAPPEMELLEVSIVNDGYTQPIVTWPKGDKNEVIDGFHRNRVGKESKLVKERIMGYLPTVIIRKDQEGKNDRIASTIRHNRARGKHTIDGMSEIVIELKNRNWTNSRISRELGMEEDEILRLCQITGLESLFKDEDFSRSWMIEDSDPGNDIFTDEIDEEEKEQWGFRTVNTSDENRIFHTYDKWECYKAGFYNTTKDGMTLIQCEEKYKEFLSNDNKFKDALNHIINEWKYSCEHYLTNNSMNRIAYLGQAAVCYAEGIPSFARGGFHLLTQEEQLRANNIALEYLDIWLKNHNLSEVTLEGGLMADKQVNIY